MEDNKNKTANLSDLRARLGLKTGEGTSKTAAEAVPPPAVVAPNATKPPAAAPAQKSQEPAAAASQSARQPQTEGSTTASPFNLTPSAGTASGKVNLLADAKPSIDVQAPKQSSAKLFIGVGIAAFVALLFGIGIGSVHSEREAFNRSIDEASVIAKEVKRISEANERVAAALSESKTRNKKIVYDQKLIDELKAVAAESPQADPKKLVSQQERLFRTNYQRMPTVVAPLMRFFTGSIQLMQQVRTFTRRSEKAKTELQAFVKSARGQAERNFGIVMSPEDLGFFYLGTLVEVGKPRCSNAQTPLNKCATKDKGFMVRGSGTGTWQFRPGKPSRSRKDIREVVIPIDSRNELWRQVTLGKPGYLLFRDYVRRFQDLSAVAESIDRETKAVLPILDKRASSEKVFVPF